MKRLGLLVLMCSLVPLAASAGSITVNWGTFTPVTVKYDNTITKNTGAGDALLTTNGVAGLPNTSFYTFCVDLQHWTQSPVNATLASMADWNTVQSRTGTDAALDYQLLGASYLGLQYYSMARPDANTRAAYQIAIWELLYETTNRTSTFGSWALAGGSVSYTNINAGILTSAENLIRGIDNTSSLYTYANLVNTTDSSGDYAQNFMAPVPDGGSMVMLLGMALVGLAGVRRMMR